MDAQDPVLEKIIVFETTIDHLTGEEIGAALSSFSQMANVLDALFLPGIGKKNRPSGLLQVLCHPDNEKEVMAAIFRHTHVLGLRREFRERYVLPRKPATLSLAGHTVKAKAHLLDGAWHARPEADALQELACELHAGMPSLRWQILK